MPTYSDLPALAPRSGGPSTARGRVRGRSNASSRHGPPGGAHLRRLLALGAVLGALSLVGCDDGGTSPPADGAAVDLATRDSAPPDGRVVDEGVNDAARPDQGVPDMAPDDMAPGDMAPGDMAPGDMAPGDMAPGDMTPGDMAPADMGPTPPPPAAPPAVVAGGGTLTSARYVMRLSVGGPAPTATTRSDRLRARLGVALPRLAAQESDR